MKAKLAIAIAALFTGLLIGGGHPHMLDSLFYSGGGNPDCPVEYHGGC